MSITTFLKLLAPPLLLNFIRKISRPRSSKLRYSTYEKAALACQQDAYQNSDLVRVVVEKNLIYREKLKSNPVFDLASLRTLIGIGISTKPGANHNRLNVIDFGGGAGYHYTVADAALGLNNSISWCVVETTAMSKEAQKLATDKLNFFDDIDRPFVIPCGT